MTDRLEITPETFEKVHFDHADIRAAFEDAAGRIGGLNSDFSATLVIDEDLPTARMAITSLDPVTFTMDSGALEDTRVPRTFGPVAAGGNFSRLIFEYLDRMNPAFGAPVLEESLGWPLRIAWDTSLFGRAASVGHRIHKPKHLYNFRNRHGFTDAADAAFEKLWNGEVRSWGEIVELCESLAPAEEATENR